MAIHRLARDAGARTTGERRREDRALIWSDVSASIRLRPVADKPLQRKLIATAVLVVIGCIGWLVPLTSHDARATIGFSIAPFFRSAGVTAWRILPFGIALQILGMLPRRRR